MSRSNFGTIQYVSKGKYRVWWEDGRSTTGKRKRASKVVNGTMDDAELYLAKIRVGLVGCTEDMTYDELWAGKVQPSFERDGLATKTVENYERVWARELRPRIGCELVASTTCGRAEDVLREISSPWVQRSAYQLWKKMCNIAIRHKVRPDNPVDKYIKLDRLPKSGKRLLDVSEVAEWMERIRGIKYEAVLLAECGGGLRHEEAIALLKDDVSRLDHRGRLYAAVNVDKALVATRHGRELKETKNGFSVREGIVGEPFASRLLELAEGEGPLCPSGEPREPGEPWEARHYSSPISFTNNYRRWCERSGVEYVTPGSLRKSWSIMHGEAGSPDSLVSLAMGHSDGTTRGRNYQRATRRGMVMIADLLTDLITVETPSAHIGT
ncbi:MAG: tyrosine-type recombinase/integrase [Eggerthella lenta]|uniref:tyrosine-type recombinase/integrase n=1 Tax=Eggerthella sp. TaxID=1929886 RepID=UPI00290720F8|nr:tyrosine-type recombinase/integrase [Eggerthella sp.]MDU5067799.1 tyrosine-type recombinase/integrase [Eggerthella sp.]